ncbi:outer kinetochore KNL1 complex subunit ZWINT isoform X2 [Erythrolamprus reginae]|uniref:outer kinetochore KNL1 complex subunit ZWINT isoform X2 n=1 Tax=Erythrolamprus reginae TaxID=121349 RepID=UPI00396CBA34
MSQLLPLRLLSQVKDVLTYEDETMNETKLELPAQVLAEFEVNTRKTQKWMYTQLQVLKFLQDFLDSVPHIQDASDSAVRKEMEEAKKEWKALKADYQQQVDAINGTVPQILAKQEEVQSRTRVLEEALQRYRAKKEEIEEKSRDAQERHLEEQELLRERHQQLEQQVAELQDRLQKQQKELEFLQGEIGQQEAEAKIWQEKMQRVSDFRGLLETLQGVKVICVSESDMELELTSQPQPEISAPCGLKLRLHWGKEGNVTLQSDSLTFLLPGELPLGTCSTLKGLLLELQHSYSQQAQLLAEIELLQNCFAIDWQPEKRLLSYLKPSSTCSLYVESGYPDGGQIRLHSIKTPQGKIDVTSYKPPQKTPSLQNWLMYLSTIDFNIPFPT